MSEKKSLRNNSVNNADRVNLDTNNVFCWPSCNIEHVSIVNIFVLFVLYFVRILRLKEGGFLEYWKKKWFPPLTCQRGAHAKAYSITLPDVVGVFLLLATGLTIAMIVLLLEHIVGNDSIICSLIKWTVDRTYFLQILQMWLMCCQ